MRATVLLWIVIFAFGFAAGAAVWAFQSKWTPSVDEESDLRLGSGGGLVNPLLDCPASPTALPPRQAEIEERTRKFVDRVKEQNQSINEISLYYRDLNNGPAFGLGTETRFSTASLLKVPVMIGYLKLVPSRPGLLDEKIQYDPTRYDLPRVTQTVDPPEALQPGQSYSIGKLLERMIISSDNVAASMLLSYLPAMQVVDVLRDMGIGLELHDDEVWVGVRQYASIFRVLYNATYLTRDLSAEALEMLSHSRMREGLVAGVPGHVIVAHKFGERSVKGVNQFHDCGIVYHPKRPYLICVMTKGAEAAPLVKTVADLSRLIFELVNAERPGAN